MPSGFSLPGITNKYGSLVFYAGKNSKSTNDKGFNILGLSSIHHYSPFVPAVRFKSGTNPAHTCHTELVEELHRAFHFHPAAIHSGRNDSAA